MRALRERLGREVSAGSLAAFRVLFGLAGFVAATRFVAMGWVDELLLAPTHHLPYAGFEWLEVPSRPVLYGLYATMALSALGVALGLVTRLSAAIYFLAFTYVELLDQALYLNHYYAVSLIAFLLIFLPLGDAYSLDARRRGSTQRTLPAWALYLLRAQLGLIYFFAGLAKLHPDWLLRAEPLRTWLLARTDVPVLGPLFGHAETAYVMAWAGMLFDLTVPFALSWRRTRPLAYAAVILFHAMTGILFNIGLFPLLMVLFTPIFFEPDWPERALAFLRRAAPAPHAIPARAQVPSYVLAACGLWLAVQIALPLRHLAMPGDRLWTYEGFNFAWHVMLVEKGAHADLLVVDRDRGTRTLVTPCEYYTPLQSQVMSENPALVAAFAHQVADDYRRAGHPHVSVYARSFAALNGREVQPLVDPEVDLITIDAWTPASRYVVPLAGEGYVFGGYRTAQHQTR